MINPESFDSNDFLFHGMSSGCFCPQWRVGACKVLLHNLWSWILRSHGGQCQFYIFYMERTILKYVTYFTMYVVFKILKGCQFLFNQESVFVVGNDLLVLDLDGVHWLLFIITYFILFLFQFDYRSGSPMCILVVFFFFSMLMSYCFGTF